MNPAQKRIWWTFAISLLTLIISGVVIVMVKQGHIDFNNHNVYRVGGAFSAIPLILFVIIDKAHPKKVLDEREVFIEKKATFAGIIGTFAFMALAACLLTIQDFEGTIQRKYLCSFVYILIFVWNLFSSSVGIACYYSLYPFNKKIPPRQFGSKKD